jgi:16S rRNA (guanine527-N7)-methyltransferase
MLERLGIGGALSRGQAHRLDAVLRALAEEPDPPTALREPALAADAHVADSLVALEVGRVRSARRIADVGAGAGFPGLVLAIALPEASVDMIESSSRKCAVIERLIRASGATNARPVPERAEAWAAGEGNEAYDLVTARAVAALPVLVEYAAPLLRQDGALVAWKGRRDAGEERAGAGAADRVGLALEDVLAVQPFPSARDRHLHLFVKRAPTPAAFPRRPGRAAKRPLA